MDERIEKIGDDVSYMRGCFETHIKFQQKLDSRLAGIQVKHGERIDKLESARDRVIGLMIGSGLGGGGIAAFLMRIFHG